MDRRDRILAAIRHEPPDQIPAHVINIDDAKPYLTHLGFDDWEALCDYLGICIRLIIPRHKKNIYGTGVFGDANGNDYSDSTCGRPLAGAASVSDISAYGWPSADDFDYGILSSALDKYYGKYAIMASGWNPIFCQVLMLFGMENALTRLCLEPSIIEAAVEHIEEFYLDFYKRFFEAVKGRADIFNMGDDFATQRGMLLSPEQWRRFFKPTYKKIFDLAKSYGLYVWFHSCGAIGAVLPDLIDIGIDVWETVQAHLPGNEPERLKREYGRDIAFFGAINTQETLPFGTPEKVRAEVRERIRVLGKGGGYICGPDHHINAKVPIENTLAMFDEINKFRHAGYTL